MKFLKAEWLVFAVVIVVLTAVGINVARADALDGCMSGAYYDPVRTGEGLTVEVLDDETMVAFFYTFGSNGLVWYTMQGNGVMPMYGTQKVSGEPFRTRTFEVGTGHVELLDANTLTFKYRLTLDADRRGAAIPWCLGVHCEGEYRYTRLTRIAGCAP